MFNNPIIAKIAQVLVVLGAINWGLSLADINLVTAVLGAYPMAVKVVYALIGVAGVFEALHHLGVTE